jgi:plasmid stabilization system protein ParE
MAFEVVLQRQAQADFDNILAWLAEKFPNALPKWLDSYERVLSRLEQDPSAFTFAPEDEVLKSSIRQALFWTGGGYVYRLLFVIADYEVRVLHIRGPGQDYVRIEN